MSTRIRPSSSGTRMCRTRGAIGETTFVNVGSAGRPKDGDWRVCYASSTPPGSAEARTSSSSCACAYDYARLLPNGADAADHELRRATGAPDRMNRP